MLHLFVKRKQSEEPYQHALEYRVHAGGALSADAMFPETYTPFTECGCRLYTPWTGALPAQTWQSFRVTVPGATGVMVSSGEERFPLQKQGDIFVGQAFVTAGDVLVFVRLPGAPVKGVLRYTAR